MWPFSEIRALEYKRVQMIEHLEPILNSVLDVLHVKGVYKYNEPGSADITYDVDGRLFEFNQFAHKFKGFFIDKFPVSITAFLSELDKAEFTIECTNLVPPKESQPRWHCDMGDGRSGDCPLLISDGATCKYQQKPGRVRKFIRAKV